MAKWENFTIWRGRFPHWRADNVEYYASFPHRQILDQDDCDILFSHLMRSHGKAVEFLALVVVPEKTEAIFTVGRSSGGDFFELTDVIAKAQRRFMKKAGKERAFYSEHFDRIIRDEAERETLLLGMLNAPSTSDAIEAPDNWSALYVAAE